MAQLRAAASIVHKEGTLKKSMIALLALCSCVIASQDAMAEGNLGLRAAGVQVGMVNPEDVDATLGFGAFADWGSLTPNIKLVSHLDYWSKSEGSAPFGEATIRDVALSMRGKYMFPVSSSTFQPFAGVGIGLHFLNAKVEVPGFPAIEDGTTKIGFDFGGGFSRPINPRMDFQAETWYGVVDGFNQFSLKGGLAFKLGM
jgi:opacity protein-like surface antigen